jgi:type IV pilus assembly protein PilN
VFAEKSFSWTAVMMDLENVLPAGLQVTSIEPLISKEGDVSIRMRVSGDRDRAVELVRNLEGSQRFLRPSLTSESLETSQTKNGQMEGAPGGVEFDILSGYNPLPMNDQRRSESKAAAADAAPARSASNPARGSSAHSRSVQGHARGGVRPAAPVGGGGR